MSTTTTSNSKLPHQMFVGTDNYAKLEDLSLDLKVSKASLITWMIGKIEDGTINPYGEVEPSRPKTSRPAWYVVKGSLKDGSVCFTLSDKPGKDGSYVSRMAYKPGSSGKSAKQRCEDLISELTR